MGVGLGHHLLGGLEPLLLHLRLEPGDGVIDVQVRVPHRQERLACELPHRRAVPLDPRQDDLAAGLGREPVLPPGHRQAGRQPLDIPLERAWQSLVEIVDVKDQPPRGEANAPKLARCASPHSCARSPEAGVVARSAAIGSAAPRKNVNADTSIRPSRTGTSSGTRLLSCSSSSPTASRPGSGVYSACDSSDATARASFPRASRSARLSCSSVPARGRSPVLARGRSPVLARGPAPARRPPGRPFLSAPHPQSSPSWQPLPRPSARCARTAGEPPGSSPARAGVSLELTIWPVTLRSPSRRHSTARHSELHPPEAVNPVRPHLEEPSAPTGILGTATELPRLPAPRFLATRAELADPDRVSDGRLSRVDGADAREEACVRDVEVVDLVRPCSSGPAPMPLDRSRSGLCLPGGRRLQSGCSCSCGSSCAGRGAWPD